MPKMLAYKSYNYTARVFNYVIDAGAPGGSKKVYSYLRDTNLDIVQGLFGRMTLLFPNDADDIMQDAQIEAIKDIDGNEIYTGGVWVLQGIIPVIHFGRREGFRSDAKLTFVGGAASI